MFGLVKTPHSDKKCFLLVINQFWGCMGLDFEVFCWLVLVCFWIERKVSASQAKTRVFVFFLQGKSRSSLNPRKFNCIWVEMNPKLKP